MSAPSSSTCPHCNASSGSLDEDAIRYCAQCGRAVQPTKETWRDVYDAREEVTVARDFSRFLAEAFPPDAESIPTERPDPSSEPTTMPPPPTEKPDALSDFTTTAPPPPGPASELTTAPPPRTDPYPLVPTERSPLVNANTASDIAEESTVVVARPRQAAAPWREITMDSQQQIAAAYPASSPEPAASQGAIPSSLIAGARTLPLAFDLRAPPAAPVTPRGPPIAAVPASLATARGHRVAAKRSLSLLVICVVLVGVFAAAGVALYLRRPALTAAP